MNLKVDMKETSRMERSMGRANMILKMVLNMKAHTIRVFDQVPALSTMWTAQ